MSRYASGVVGPTRHIEIEKCTGLDLAIGNRGDVAVVAAWESSDNFVEGVVNVWTDSDCAQPLSIPYSER